MKSRFEMHTRMPRIIGNETDSNYEILSKMYLIFTRGFNLLQHSLGYLYFYFSNSYFTLVNIKNIRNKYCFQGPELDRYNFSVSVEGEI